MVVLLVPSVRSRDAYLSLPFVQPQLAAAFGDDLERQGGDDGAGRIGVECRSSKAGCVVGQRAARRRKVAGA